MTEAKNCVPLMSRCCLMVRILVSACKCSVGVDCVLPRMILSAVFWMICSLFSCVLDKAGCQAGLA